MRMPGLAAALAAAGLCAVVLSGCAPAGSSSSGTTAPSAAITSAPTASPSASAGGGSAAGSSALPVEPDGGASAAQHCSDEQLALAYRARPQDSGAGSFFGDLVFTNTSATACSFDGWPGLIAQDADGAQLGAPARAEGDSSSIVTLAPNGGTATARLHGTQPGASDCPEATSTTLRAVITSDGAGAGVAVAQAIPVCGDDTATLGIGALTAG